MLKYGPILSLELLNPTLKLPSDKIHPPPSDKPTHLLTEIFFGL